MRWRLRKRHGPKLWLCLFILPVIAHFTLRRAEPAFYARCSDYSNAAFTRLVGGCIADMSRQGKTGSFLVTEKDEDGRIVSIETDTARLNTAKSELLVSVQSALAANYPAHVNIPLGSLTPYPLLTYYGPAIRVKIIPISIVRGELEERFDDAGINQVRHSITLVLSVDMRYTGYAMNETERIRTEVPLAETILPGTVPQYYGTGMVEIPN